MKMTISLKWILITGFMIVPLESPFSAETLGKDKTVTISPTTKSDLMSIEEMNPSLINETVSVLAAHFNTNVAVNYIVRLSEPERRNLILRIFIQPKEGFPVSLILKQTVVDSDSEKAKEDLIRFARDWAGLEFLSCLHKEDSSTPTTPRFYGGSLKHHFVLLEDLGEKHISLVDSLTSDNPENAKAALGRFVACLGKFHANSFGKTDEYNAILQRLNPTAKSWKEALDLKRKNLMKEISVIGGALNISLTEKLSSEIEEVLQENLMPGPFTTYIHGDICPDNVFDNPEKNELRFIDFEWGKVGNAILDGTYLRMAMPTCWCSKTIPDDLIDSLEAIYREKLAEKIPQARNDTAYHYAYTSACAFWMLNNLIRIDQVMEKDDCWNSGPTLENSLWKSDQNMVRPRIITRLQAFIQVAKKHDLFPNLQSLTEQILKELKTRWPNAKPMDMYPAFEEQ